jgi:hypothetical protein
VRPTAASGQKRKSARATVRFALALRDCDDRSLAGPEPDRQVFAKFKHLLRKAAALCRNHLRHNRRNPPSIYAHRMRQLFAKLRLDPILKTIMP